MSDVWIFVSARMSVFRVLRANLPIELMETSRYIYTEITDQAGYNASAIFSAQESGMGMTKYYKVSIVVVGGKHPGAIINTNTEPQVGDIVRHDGQAFEVIEVDELMPNDGDYGFLHATCRLLR